MDNDYAYKVVPAPRGEWTVAERDTGRDVAGPYRTAAEAELAMLEYFPPK